MGRTGAERAQAPRSSGWSTAGTAAAYAAAVVALAYALVSLYWAVGGQGLVSTVGGYVEQFARRGGAVPVLVALAAAAVKVAGGRATNVSTSPVGRSSHWASSATTRTGTRAALSAIKSSAASAVGNRSGEKIALVRLRLSKALPGAAETQAMAAGALAIERGVATEQIAAAEGLALHAAAFSEMPDPVLHLAARARGVVTGLAALEPDPRAPGADVLLDAARRASPACSSSWRSGVTAPPSPPRRSRPPPPPG